jgi:hypothetical protein
MMKSNGGEFVRGEIGIPNWVTRVGRRLRAQPRAYDVASLFGVGSRRNILSTLL